MLSVVRLVSFWRCIPVQYNCQKSSNFQGLSHFSRIFGKNDKIPGFFQAGKTVTTFPGAVGTLQSLPGSIFGCWISATVTMLQPKRLTLKLLELVFSDSQEILQLNEVVTCRFNDSLVTTNKAPC